MEGPLQPQVSYTYSTFGLIPRRWHWHTNDAINSTTGLRHGRWVKIGIRKQFNHWWDINNPLRRRVVTTAKEREDFLTLVGVFEPVGYSDSDTETDIDSEDEIDRSKYDEILDYHPVAQEMIDLPSSTLQNDRAVIASAE